MEKQFGLLAHNLDEDSKRAKCIKKSHYSFNSSSKDTSKESSLHKNIFKKISYKKLYSLAVKLRADCYRQDKSSDEIVHEFLIGIERIRRECR